LRDAELLQEHLLLQLLEKLGLEQLRRVYASLVKLLTLTLVPVRQQIHLCFRCLLLAYFF
jgi:hypothetical protein